MVDLIGSVKIWPIKLFVPEPPASHTKALVDKKDRQPCGQECMYNQIKIWRLTLKGRNLSCSWLGLTPLTKNAVVYSNFSTVDRQIIKIKYNTEKSIIKVREE